MSEIESLSRLREELREPNEEQITRARRRLDHAIASAKSLASPPARPRPPSKARFLIPALILVVGIPAGIAVGGALENDGDEISPGRALGPEDCPEATAAFEGAGVRAPTFAASDGCPPPARVEELIEVLRRDQRNLKQLEARTERSD